MELIVSFQETPRDNGQFAFDLTLDGQSHQRDNPFTFPMDEHALADLRWYLEDYLDYPYGPFRDRGLRIEAMLDKWGEALFQAIFSTAEARVLYDRLVESDDPERFLTIMSPDPRVLRLPWELMRDQAGPVYSAGISIRRHVEQRLTPALPRFSLPLKVLYVTSRPIDTSFVDPRFSAQRVMDALAPLIEQELVEVDFVRPATFDQLGHVLSPDRGQYHIFHFDGHGFYDDNLGLGGLAFEDLEYRTHLVTADELGNLLNRRGIALVVLGACRTGREVEAKAFSSVAARLIIAGVGSVICMSYSVYVEAARLFMLRFYETLVDARPIGAAVRTGRDSLMTSPWRIPSIDKSVTLKDWFIPLLYQRGADSAPLAKVRKPRKKAKPRFRQPAEGENLGAFPPSPRYGFVGRSRERLDLERKLLNHKVVVMHGFGGIGKTMLAREAAYWLTKTGMFPGGAVFTTFEHGETDEQAILAVGEYAEGFRFLRRPIEERETTVEAYLTEHPTLVVWDSFETVLEEHYPTENRDRLLRLARQWTGLRGGSRLLITSRQPNVDIPGAAKVELGSLSERDALTFAEVILGKEGIDQNTVDRYALQRLMDLLGNHAQSLVLVLPKLQEMSVDQIMDEFEGLLPGFKIGEGRTESLVLSLEFSLQRLGDETRKFVPTLAIFRGGAMEAMVAEASGLEWIAWQQVKQELLRTGLISVDSTIEVRLGQRRGGYVTFHPTLPPFLESCLDDQHRTSLRERYWRAYLSFADFVAGSFSGPNSVEAPIVARRELPNFRRALTWAYAAGAYGQAARFAAQIAQFLMALGRYREAGQVTAQSISAMSPEGSKVQGEYQLLSVDADLFIRNKQWTEAEIKLDALLTWLQERATEPGIELDRSATLVQLARCKTGRGEFQQAEDLCQEALRALRQVNTGDSRKRRIAALAHAELGQILATTGRFWEADEHLQEAFALAKQGEDVRQVAVVFQGAAYCALQQGDLERARRWTEQQLIIFKALGEQESIATSLFQLGIILCELGDHATAERCYRESLMLATQTGHEVLQAKLWCQVGILAFRKGDLAMARDCYLHALPVLRQANLDKDLSILLSNLANLYLAFGQLDEAEKHAQEAAQLKEKVGPSSEPWKTYGIMAQIAARRGQVDKATVWSQRAEQAFNAFWTHRKAGEGQSSKE